MKLDPYAELDVGLDADETVIRAAYRRRSKETHPDGGGTAEAFARTTTALAVLTDPERRRHYDETGEIEDKPVDNARQKALGLIHEVLGGITNRFIAGGFRPQDDPRYLNLCEIINGQIGQKIRDEMRMITTGHGAVAFYLDMAQRFSLTTGEADNPFSRNFEDLARDSRKAIEELKRSIETSQLAQKILAETNFRFDIRPELTPTMRSTGGWTFTS